MVSKVVLMACKTWLLVGRKPLSRDERNQYLLIYFPITYRSIAYVFELWTKCLEWGQTNRSIYRVGGLVEKECSDYKYPGSIR